MGVCCCCCFCTEERRDLLPVGLAVLLIKSVVSHLLMATGMTRRGTNPGQGPLFFCTFVYTHSKLPSLHRVQGASPALPPFVAPASHLTLRFLQLLHALVVLEIGTRGPDTRKSDSYGPLAYAVGGGGGGKERETSNLVERVAEEEWGVE